MTRDQLIIAIHETRGRLKAMIAAAQPGDPLAADASRLVSSLGRIEQRVGADPTGSQRSEQTDDFDWLTKAVDLLGKRAAAGSNGSVWTTRGFWAVFGLFAIMCGAIALAMRSIGTESIQTMEGGRAVLLLALTMAFVILGGSLLIAPLFGEGPLKDRFPFSREIFLLFAGMFTTIVGFYFASADLRGVGSLLVAETFDAAVPEVRVLVAGGRPPYSVKLKIGSDDRATTLPVRTLDSPGTVVFTIDRAATPWPDAMLVTVQDVGGHIESRTIKPDPDVLVQARFVKPAAKSTEPSTPSGSGASRPATSTPAPSRR